MSQSVITAPLEPTETWDPWRILPQSPQTGDEHDAEDEAEPNVHANCRVAAQFLM